VVKGTAEGGGEDKERSGTAAALTAAVPVLSGDPADEMEACMAETERRGPRRTRGRRVQP
jgi:hypothetical protein